MKNFKNNTKTNNKLPMPGKVKKGFRFYCMAVLTAAFVLGSSMTALPPATRSRVDNNLICFISA